MSFPVFGKTIGNVVISNNTSGPIVTVPEPPNYDLLIGKDLIAKVRGWKLYYTDVFSIDGKKVYIMHDSKSCSGKETVPVIIGKKLICPECASFVPKKILSTAVMLDENYASNFYDYSFMHRTFGYSAVAQSYDNLIQKTANQIYTSNTTSPYQHTGTTWSSIVTKIKSWI